MGLQYDDVVNHHGCQHDDHLQLVVDPQEHRAGDQAQDATVDEVLGGEGNGDEQKGYYMLLMLKGLAEQYFQQTVRN